MCCDAFVHGGRQGAETSSLPISFTCLLTILHPWQGVGVFILGLTISYDESYK